MVFLVHMVGAQATFLVHILDGREPQFFARCLIPYQLDGRYVHLRVQLWKALLVAMMD